MKPDICFTNLQTESAGEVRLGHRDDHTADISLLEPFGEQLEGQKFLQPVQTLDVEGQQEHHTGLALPKRHLQNLHHVFHVLVVAVQTWKRG